MFNLQHVLPLIRLNLLAHSHVGCVQVSKLFAVAEKYIRILIHVEQHKPIKPHLRHGRDLCNIFAYMYAVTDFPDSIAQQLRKIRNYSGSTQCIDKSIVMLTIMIVIKSISTSLNDFTNRHFPY